MTHPITATLPLPKARRKAPSTLLCIDPSSTLCGYALFKAGVLTECGLLKPQRTRDDANDRIKSMVAEATCVALQDSVDLIIIEDTSGKVGARHGGHGAGLAIHGKAVGWMIGSLRAHYPVECVLENEWTRGIKKVYRQAVIAVMFPKLYDPKKDKGGDAADAIGLGMYWLARITV